MTASQNLKDRSDNHKANFVIPANEGLHLLYRLCHIDHVLSTFRKKEHNNSNRQKALTRLAVRLACCCIRARQPRRRVRRVIDLW